MKLLAYIFVVATIVMALCSLFYIIKFVYVRIKAFIIRRKRSKFAEMENKDD